MAGGLDTGIEKSSNRGREESCVGCERRRSATGAKMRRGRQGWLVNQGWEGLVSSSSGATASGKTVEDEWGAAIGEGALRETIQNYFLGMWKKGDEMARGVMLKLLAHEVP